MVSEILNFVVYPLGWIGAGLIWYTIFSVWRNGPNESDDLTMALGYLVIVVSDVMQIICDLLIHDFVSACTTGGWLVLLIVIWTWKGPPSVKKKVKKLLGDKARAVKAKIVKKMREAGDHLPKPGWGSPLPVPA